MKRTNLFVVMVMMLFVLAACGPDQPEQSAPTAVPPTTAPVENDIAPRPTVTAVPDAVLPTPMADENVLEGYPVMQATAVPSEYPNIDYAALPTRNPYPAPGEYVWVVVPMGAQCAESVDYPTAQDAANALMVEGIAVYDRMVVDMVVCTACGCPTSTQYNLQILATDQAAAEEMGWLPAEDQ